MTGPLHQSQTCKSLVSACPVDLPQSGTAAFATDSVVTCNHATFTHYTPFRQLHALTVCKLRTRVRPVSYLITLEGTASVTQSLPSQHNTATPIPSCRVKQTMSTSPSPTAGTSRSIGAPPPKTRRTNTASRNPFWLIRGVLWLPRFGMGSHWKASSLDTLVLVGRINK